MLTSSCEIPDTPKVEPTAAIAVDVGTTHYLTTSEGEKEDNPRWYRQAEGLLRKHSLKTFPERKKALIARQKQKHKLSLHQERTTNKRKDFIGKLVYKLYHHYEKQCLSGRRFRHTSNMVKNKHLSKSISAMRLGEHSLSGLGTWFPKETVSISTKSIPKILRKLCSCLR